MKEAITMKDLPGSEQPYELLEERGASSLTDAQLLSIFLHSGVPGEKALDMAYRILSQPTFQGRDPLSAFFNLSPTELREIKGVGRVKSIRIQAVGELAKRLISRDAAHRVSMTRPDTVASLFMEEARFLKQETAWVLYLNTKLELLYSMKLTTGTLNQTLIDSSVIFLKAYEKGAYAFLLLHNHPSGNPGPSAADDRMTERLRDQGAIMEIPLLDHIILGDRKYYSYKENSHLLS